MEAEAQGLPAVCQDRVSQGWQGQGLPGDETSEVPDPHILVRGRHVHTNRAYSIGSRVC
jgi:hypothetical protein